MLPSFNNPRTRHTQRRFVAALAFGIYALISALVTATAAPAKEAATVIAEPTYNQDIRPILTVKCFGCHGAALSEGAEIHLHDRELAISSGAITPGDSGASEMIRRVLLPSDDNQFMPPKTGHTAPLTNAEIQTLRNWIDQGAEYEEHWSFVPVTRPEPPQPQKFSDWIRNDIDAFVLDKMVSRGFEPNPRDGDPHRLIRRLALDLTGLPPTAEQVSRFAENPTDETYNAIIDELFASPAYGEHWARIWLDAVRYADTHGIHLDNYRSIWPYRDWVIDSYNRNQPFDQFTIEQIAGDMLPDPTFEQRIATGYNRCLPTSSEAGQINEEWAVTYANDRVATTFGIWQGLTAACAACHDHKYDPLSQKEYYQLTAYFRNNTMPIDDGDVENTPPSIKYPTREQSAELARLRAVQHDLQRQYKDAAKLDSQTVAQWIASRHASPELPATDGLIIHDRSTDVATTSTQMLGEVEHVAQNSTRQLPVPAEAGADISRGFSIGGWFRSHAGNPRGQLWGKARFDNGRLGWEVTLRPGEATIFFHSDRNERLVLKTRADVTNQRWNHLYIVLDPTREKGQQATVYINGEVAELRENKGYISPSASLATTEPLFFGRRNANDDSRSETITQDGFYQRDFQLYERALSADEVALHFAEPLVTAAATTDQFPSDKKLKSLVEKAYLMLAQPDVFALRLARNAAKSAADDFDRQIPVSLIMEEKKDSEPFAHVLDRGAYDAPLEKVSAGTPAMLPPMPDGAPNNRLGLAQWLVSKDNPLTARVTMNRYWYNLFGRGIVPTVEDLGTSGDQPVNGPLLDYLASEFMNADWDVQHMLRLMVNSSTYRQAQEASPEKFAADKENVYLSRAPRYRLDGEQLRDLALAASGLLIDKIGGKPTKPYQPIGVWENVAMLASNTKVYEEEDGEGLYRRSLYTFWKRTAGHAAMVIFDAPNRDVFCVRRERTNTPLQAFVTLNDTQFVEAARVAGQQAVNLDGSFTDRANHLGQAFLSRDFTTSEIASLQDTYDFALAEFTAHPDDAAAVLSTGHAPADPAIPQAKLAAWAIVASQVLNLDEALTK